MKTIRKLAYAYAGLSIAIGPVILMLTIFRHPSGGDCYDGSWGNTPLNERVDIYAKASLDARLLATIMILAGITLL